LAKPHKGISLHCHTGVPRDTVADNVTSIKFCAATQSHVILLLASFMPMRNGSLLGTVVAIAHVPFDRVQPLLTSEGAPTLLNLADRTAGLAMGAEPDHALVWLHGSYWYQGEYLFAAHPRGTEVTYRIRNISGHPGFAIRLWQRRILRDQQHHLDQYVADLERRL